MVPVHPDELKTQHVGDVVVYALSFDAWDLDLARSVRTAKATATILRGAACAVTLLDDDRARRCARIRVRATGPGYYQIHRTVTTVVAPQEQRQKSFRVLVE